MCKPTFPEKRVLAAETFFRNGRAARQVSETEVKFETPVNFCEVKILSPLMYLSTSTGGLILGNTDPSQITLQFSCNNVHRPDDTNMIDLGTIEYQENRRTTFTCHTNIWSDKLIVSGKFCSLTIGVYGLPQDTDAEALQGRDRAVNLPNLEAPGGIPEVVAFPEYFLNMEDSLVIDRFECTDTTDSDSDVNVTSDRSEANSDVDEEDEDGDEEDVDGEEDEEGEEEDGEEEEYEEGDEDEDDDGNSNLEEDDDGSSTMNDDDDDDDNGDDNNPGDDKGDKNPGSVNAGAVNGNDDVYAYV